MTSADPHARVHDGFYLRLGLGFGSIGGTTKLTVTTEDGASEWVSGDVSASAPAFEIGIGGSPIPGLAVAGTIFGVSASGFDVKAKGDTAHSTQSLTVSAIGATVDGYPNPRGGFHVGGTVGLASINVGDTSSSSSVGATAEKIRPTGVAVSPFVGYELWLSDQWSLGALVRLTWVKAKGSTKGSVEVTDAEPVNGSAPTIGFEATEEDTLLIPTLAIASSFH